MGIHFRFVFIFCVLKDLIALLIEPLEEVGSVEFTLAAMFHLSLTFYSQMIVYFLVEQG